MGYRGDRALSVTIVFVVFLAAPFCVEALTLECRQGLIHIHEAALKRKNLDLPAEEAQAVKEEVSHRIRKHRAAFELMLRGLGLTSVRVSEEGIPILEFGRYELKASFSAAIMQAFSRARVDFPKDISEDEAYRLDEEFIKHSFLQERARYVVDTDEYELFVDTSHGVVAGMRDAVTKEVLIVAVAEGSEVLSGDTNDWIISHYLHLSPDD